MAAGPGDKNIVSALDRQAFLRPLEIAIHEPVIPGFRRYERAVTYGELKGQTIELAMGMASLGIRPGDRVAVFVPPSLDSYAAIFALFRLGATPVLIDPGIGIRSLGHCLKQAGPVAFIGVAKAHLARLLFGWGRETVRLPIQVGFTLPGAGIALNGVQLLGQKARTRDLPDPGHHPAAILFTSGSTGPAKGVVYQHRHFHAQLRMLGNQFHLGAGDVDIPTFPLFGLFGPALGMRETIPQMDFTRPGRVNPAMLIHMIKEHRATTLFGSPALLRRLCTYAVPRGIKLPTLKRVVSAGAPVPFDIVEKTRMLLRPGVDVHTPYGATEALPVSSIHGEEILNHTREETRKGQGVCVGFPLPGIQVRILPISDLPVDSFEEDDVLPAGIIGEITVSGPIVTEEYFGRPDLTELHKAMGPGGALFHRMGDVGHLDEQGRLWMCGRKSQRVQGPTGTLFTESIEGIFTGLKGVRRTALVGARKHGQIHVVLCVEPEGTVSWGRLLPELKERALAHPGASRIEAFLRHHSFPVDIRHNSKIQREKLAIWAARRLP